MRTDIAAVAISVFPWGSAARSAVRKKPELEPPTRASVEGNVGVQFFESPDAFPPPDRNSRVHPPRPVSIPPPPYPEKLLSERRPPVAVTLGIALETDGTVGEVDDSPLAGRALSAENAPFREAAVRAVRSWKFTPAMLEILRDGTDLDGDGNPEGRILVSANPVRDDPDVAIRFEVVEGKGKVDTGLASRGRGSPG